MTHDEAIEAIIRRNWKPMHNVIRMDASGETLGWIITKDGSAIASDVSLPVAVAKALVVVGEVAA